MTLRTRSQIAKMIQPDWLSGTRGFGVAFALGMAWIGARREAWWVSAALLVCAALMHGAQVVAERDRLETRPR